MSLAELFYARQAARRIRRIFPRRRRPGSPRRFELEALEPRLLLDAIPPILPNLVAGSIDGPGEVDRYTFTLATDARLYIDSQTNNSNIRWTLTGPAGTAVSDRALSNTDAIEGPGLLGLVAGDYTLTVDGTGDTTGPYGFRLLDLATLPVITPGTPVSGALDPAAETDGYRFIAQAGDRIFLDATARSGAPSARWRLLDPFSNVLFERDFGGISSDAGPLTLATAGTYTLLLEGRVFEGGTGSYTFTVVPQGNTPPPPPPVGTPLTLGSTINGALGAPGEQDIYSFNLPAPGAFYFDSLTNIGSLRWTLQGPAGITVSERPFTGSDSHDIGNPRLGLVAGAYTLTVSGTGDATGPYSFRLLDLAAAPPSPRAPPSAAPSTPPAKPTPIASPPFPATASSSTSPPAAAAAMRSGPSSIPTATRSSIAISTPPAPTSARSPWAPAGPTSSSSKAAAWMWARPAIRDPHCPRLLWSLASPFSTHAMAHDRRRLERDDAPGSMVAEAQRLADGETPRS